MNSNNTIIKNLTDGLNPQQEKAVTAPFDRHYLVLAGAGCGKTSVLTKRIAFSAHTFCEQKDLLALTFTRKAAEEMRDRVMDLPGIVKEKELPVVTTFHGFSLKVLRDRVGDDANIKKLGYTKEPKLLSSMERLKIIAALTTRDERRDLKLDIIQIDNLLARYIVNKDKTRKLPEEVQIFLSKLADKFAQKKIEENAWEFSDMITKAILLFSENENIVEYYSKRFNYILVDEFQDTNPLQISLLNYLLSENNRIFAVGDDDQAIYGFRGADIEPTIHFDTYFSGAEIIKLETNYRSKPAILSCANKIFKDKPANYRKVLRSGKYSNTKEESGRKPQKKSFQNMDEMIQWVMDTIHSVNKTENIPISEMALLFRINETLENVKEVFHKYDNNRSELPNFLTVHGSKGLEFPVVFLCDLEESVFPSYRQQKTRKIRSWFDLFKALFSGRKHGGIECDFDEEKRLFYVGVTRAERVLYLISVKEKIVNGRKTIFIPSRFLRLV
jgi:superfamily I DNA/RNA helicase